MKTIASGKDIEKKGETRAKGSFALKNNGTSAQLVVKLDVRKSGMTGTGKGVLALQIMDSEWNTLNTIKKKITVGAEIDGSASKDWKKTLTFVGPKSLEIITKGSILAFQVRAKSDTNILTGIKEWAESLVDVKDLKKLVIGIAVGGFTQANGWQIYRIR